MDTAPAGDRVFYLYGVIPKGQSYPSEEGVPLQAVVHAELVALVEPVCAREFSSAALDERLGDIEWVSLLARRHETVLEGAMRHGVVAPARLCTLFTSTLALRQSLAANEQRFLEAFARMRGREEWGVKAFRIESRCAGSQVFARAGLVDATVRSLNAALATATPGHAFVLRKQRDARLAEIAAERICDVANQAGAALERAAVDLRLLRLLPPDRSSTGKVGEIMVLNLAALVDETAREAFHSVVARLAKGFREEGFRFELSGPWPPYNFCTQGEEDPPIGAFRARGQEI
jgi:hypothetical protein